MTPMNAMIPKPLPFKPHVSVEMIDPERAQWYLACNTMNRPMSPNTVQKYAEQMLAGKWMTNGDTITFAGDVLIDGQHRLAAIVKAGVTLEMIVVRNVCVDAFATKDNGKKRAGSDVLAVLGQQNTNVMSAVLTRLAHYYLGRNVISSWKPFDVRETLMAYPEVGEVCANYKMYRAFRHGASVLAAYIICSRINKEQADEFFARLVDGIGLSVDSQERVLREQLLRLSTSQGNVAQGWTVLAWIIKAWNAKRQGRKITLLVWKRGKEQQEAFPKAI